MQMVFLSARPAVLAETLDHVRHFMAFVDDVVVQCPAHLVGAMADIGTVTVVADEDVTGAGPDEIARWDHTTRNFRLRAALATHPAVAEEFLMADDDNRPLQPVELDTFVDDRSRHRNYWFTELARWNRDEVPFDLGLTHALLVLRQRGVADPLAYASHMPQIVDRELFAAATGSVAAEARRYPLDEWSIYFNLARHEHPGRFAPPEPFVTLGWPRFPGEWHYVVQPAGFVFENHHPELYEPGALFEGLPTTLAPDRADSDALEKAVRWHRFGLALHRLEIDDTVDNPYTQGNRWRRAFFRGTRPLRKVVEYATIGDRAELASLAGRVRTLEQRLAELEDRAGRP